MDDPFEAAIAASDLSAQQHVHYAVEGAVASITLARAEASNALNLTSLAELSWALGQVELSEEIKLVVIRGSEKAFSSGFDISEHTEDNVYQLVESLHGVVRKLVELEAVSISAVRGMALGAGCELAVCCDFCFAAEGAKLGQPEIKAGLFPTVSPVVYPRLMGLHRAFELILTGRILEAREAESIGLVTRAVQPDQLDAEIDKWTSFLGGFSTPVLRLARRAVSAAADLPFEDGLRQVQSMYLNQLMATEDAQEGVRALAERRSPEWKHR